jgi:hypothetical protein
VNGSSPFASGTANFHMYGQDNWVDADRDGQLDGSLITPYPVEPEPKEPEHPPVYAYGYEVADHKTGDFKSKLQVADGKSVKVSRKILAYASGKLSPALTENHYTISGCVYPSGTRWHEENRRVR